MALLKLYKHDFGEVLVGTAPQLRELARIVVPSLEPLRWYASFVDAVPFGPWQLFRGRPLMEIGATAQLEELLTEDVQFITATFVASSERPRLPRASTPTLEPNTHATCDAGYEQDVIDGVRIDVVDTAFVELTGDAETSRRVQALLPLLRLRLAARRSERRGLPGARRLGP